MTIFAKTATRVRDNTREDINDLIQWRTTRNIERYAMADRQAIERRLGELDVEWDIERVLETNAASFALLGILLGTFVNRRWYLLSGVVSAFLLQHSVQGWCPPMPLLRRLGLRTAREIDDERGALLDFLDRKLR